MSTTKNERPLVLCFDGTSDRFDDDNTNVVKFFGLLKKDDFNEQLCYYQPGIGTWYEPGMVSPLFRSAAKLLDLGFAWYFDAHVMEGYKFIMKNYRVGDKIYLFGFSRGAYIARAVAALLHRVGLLPRDNERQVPFAYELYKHSDKRCKEFKRTFCEDVKVQFVGVWDTVSSVGTLLQRTLPPTDCNDGIKTFRHALALDEHRARFHPEYSHFKQIQASTEPDSKCETETARPSDSERSNSVHSPEQLGFFSKLFRKRTSKGLIAKEPDDEDVDTSVLEVWFSGCHCDVGGGARRNKKKKQLSNISLRWMVREVQKSDNGILFKEKALKKIGIGPLASVKSESEEAAIRDTEYKDALLKTHDMLKKNWLWWILEFLPYNHTSYDENQKQRHAIRWNFGRGRMIPEGSKPNFHESVRKRVHHLKRVHNLKREYKPKAKCREWRRNDDIDKMVNYVE